MTAAPTLAAASEPGETGPDPDRPNLVLLIVDTLRADHLGSYGYGRPTSPSIDRIAREGVRFESAFSVAPWTLPSAATILTGLLPSSHGAAEATTKLDPDVETLAERLRAEGYETGAMVSHIFMAKNFRMLQGFDSFKVRTGDLDYVSTDRLVEDALSFLDTTRDSAEPFFLLVHLFDPHYDYIRHPEYGFATSGEGRLTGQESIDDLTALEAELTPPEIALVEAVYDEEIAYTDAGIGRILSALDESDRAANTLVVLTADHGEEFLDHGRLGHAHSLYDELLHVPLILRLPGTISAGRVIGESVSLIHLFPTILDLLGARASDESQGRSLAPRVLGTTGIGTSGPDSAAVEVEADTDAGRVPLNAVFAEVEYEEMSARMRSLRRGDFKLILDLEDGSTELFDVRQDPGESRDLAEASPERVQEMMLELKALISLSRSRGSETGPAQLTDRERERLRSLGYIR